MPYLLNMTNETRTWHYGLVARWWAEFNVDGPEIALFREYIEKYGDPVLDTGCGTGRLMIPYLESGLQVDGTDASADMLNWCRKKLEDKGLKANLYTQAMHQLDLPRHYQSIINCGAFGLGGSRGQDLEGLRRVYHHLNPGGAFIMDCYLPNFDEEIWLRWLPDHKSDFPTPFEKIDERKKAADGTELELLHRRVNFDPLQQTVERELQVNHYQDGELLASERGTIVINIYFMNEIILMLKHVGFQNISVESGRSRKPPKPWEDSYIVFVAEKRTAGME